MKVANIDADGIYWGMKDAEIAVAGDVVFGAEQIAAEARIEGVVYLDGECDLPGGKYRWNAESGQFLALARTAQRASPLIPSSDHALYAFLLEAARRDLSAVPPYSRTWALWYETTFDGTADAGAFRKLVTQ